MTHSDFVCDYVREAILKGELAPGDRLREKDLEERLGVSRTPIREAMKSLEAQGLISLESWKGAFISKLSRRQVVELYELRLLLETFAVKVVATSASADELVELEDILRKSESSDMKEHYVLNQLNALFHRKLCELSGNRFVLETLDPLSVSFALMPGNAYGEQGQWDKVLKEHRMVLDAIYAKDPKKAGELIRAHIFQSGLARLREWT